MSKLLKQKTKCCDKFWWYCDCHVEKIKKMSESGEWDGLIYPVKDIRQKGYENDE